MGFFSDAWDFVSGKTAFDWLTGQEGIDEANRANQARYQQVLDLFDQLQADTKSGGKNIQSILEKAGLQLGQGLQGTEKRAAKELQRGYGEAQQLALEQGMTARRGIMQAGEQRAASASSALQKAGLGSTTRGANLARAVGSDTDFAVGNLAEKIAGLRSGLAERRGTALGGLRERMGGLQAQSQYGVQSDIARLLERLGLQHQGIEQSKINAILGREDVPGPSPLQYISQIAGTVGAVI